jgi:predicted transposase/invertase (TIGR01784 family)
MGAQVRREEALQLGMERGMKKAKEERSLEIAEIMKKKGETVDTIAEYTGLSNEEIEKI